MKFGGHFGQDHEMMEVLILGEVKKGSGNCCLKLLEGCGGAWLTESLGRQS